MLRPFFYFGFMNEVQEKRTYSLHGPSDLTGNEIAFYRFRMDGCHKLKRLDHFQRLNII